MHRLETLQHLFAWRETAPGPVALVATMGALHAGHLRHISAAREAGARTVLVTVFVNPTQFNDPADLAAYPRTLEADAKACESAGASALFAPQPEAFYPPGQAAVLVDVPSLTRGLGLEDAFRPGHFEGVARIVTKLLAAVRPDLATFGRKDLQQLRLVQALVADLCLGVEILEIPTLRESDGLAMSSRNARLGADERRIAAALPASLAAAHAAAASPSGQHPSRGSEALRALKTGLASQRGLQVEYAEVRNADTLGEIAPLAPLDPSDKTEPSHAPLVAMVAARVGPVRLLDNLFLDEPLPFEDEDAPPSS